MRGRRMMWTGMIGFIVGLVALAVCLILPAALGPNMSWGEAMLGIIPAGVLTLVFLVLMLIGMASMVSNQQEPRQRSRRDEHDEDEYDGRGPPRRSRRDYDDEDDEYEDDDRGPRRRRSR